MLLSIKVIKSVLLKRDIISELSNNSLLNDAKLKTVTPQESRVSLNIITFAIVCLVQ